MNRAEQDAIVAGLALGLLFLAGFIIGALP